jgi:hypothetical protein
LLLIGPAMDRDPFPFSYDRSPKISRNYMKARSSTGKCHILLGLLRSD